MLTAFAVVAAASWFAKMVFEKRAGRWTLGRTAVVLAVLVSMQLALGVEAWVGQYAGPLPPDLQPVTARSALVRTLHVLVGAGVLATAVIAAVQAYRAALIRPVMNRAPNRRRKESTRPFRVRNR